MKTGPGIEWETLTKEMTTLHGAGHLEEAVILAIKAVDVAEANVGSEHPLVAVSLVNLAFMYMTADQYAQAEPLYKRALSIDEEAFGVDHPNVARKLTYLAELYHKRGQYAMAEPLYTRALAIREEALDPDHPDTAFSLNQLALLHQCQGLYDLAEPFFKRSLAILERTFGQDHPEVALSLSNLAKLYSDRGQIIPAHALFKRAFEISFKTSRTDDSTILKVARMWLANYAFFSPQKRAILADEWAKECTKQQELKPMEWQSMLPPHLPLCHPVALELEECRNSIGCPHDAFALRIIGSGWATRRTQRVCYDKAMIARPFATEQELIETLYQQRKDTGAISGQALGPLPTTCRKLDDFVQFLIHEEAQDSSTDPFGWGARIDSILAKAD